ncbi:unnamed protein product [Heterobilharzia americana]|nr:unnamed protein product [Heterobilharzia americana]
MLYADITGIDTKPRYLYNIQDETINDSMTIAIKDIMKVLETLNHLSTKEYKSIDGDDEEEVEDIEKNVEIIRYPQINSEYKNIPCNFKCFLRPKINSREYRKVSETALHLPDKNIAILDCFNSTIFNQTTDNNILSSKWNKSITSQCVTHFTSRLLHIVIGTLSNESDSNFFTFTSDRMSTIIYNYILNYIKPITDLYLTLALPMFRLDRNDFNKLSPWLRYISLDGKMLRHLDVMLVANLSLDYFIIQDCVRKEETMINPRESSLPDSRIELTRNNDNNNNNNENECLVYWRYSCPNYPEFILVADLKVHERRCPINTKHFYTVSLKKTLDNEKYFQQVPIMTTQSINNNNLRAKRSPKRSKSRISSFSTSYTTLSSSSSPTTEDRTTKLPSTISTPQLTKQFTSISPQNQTLTESCASMSKFITVLEGYLSRQSDNDCEQKLVWLRNTITVLVAILLLMTMILLAALIILSYFIRQYTILQRENKMR